MVADWLLYGARLSIGWGGAVAVWLVTIHRAAVWLVSRVPRAWRLWRRSVLTTLVPLLKALVGGAVLLGGGGGLVWWLFGVASGAFDPGLWAGLVTGALWSVSTLPGSESRVDFLLANRRHVNQGKVSISLKE